MEPSFTPFPVLESDRLMLREIEEGDVADIYFLQSNTDVLQYLDSEPSPSPEATRIKMIKVKNDQLNNHCIEWGICLRGEENKVIGLITYWRIMNEHYRAEIGYRLDPAYHQRGIMSEAMTMVMKYGQNTMKLHSIEANINPSNTASILLLTKHGFEREGHFKENFYFNGRFIDSDIYSRVFI
jgi:ribosomal-protein-alanine N-acetyltransferase